MNTLNSNRYLPILLTAIGLVCGFLPDNSLAFPQNPLRKRQETSRQVETPIDIDYSDRLKKPQQYLADFQPTIPEYDSVTAPKQNSEQQQIRLATYQAQSPIANQSEPESYSPRTQNLIASTEKLPWQDPNAILDLIMKISLNLVFVLSFAFGAILLARKWMKNNGGNQANDRLSSDSLTVLQTLRIDPKISIRLVQWRSNRFLIACDQNGIQSVNTLNDSFDQTLTELESEDQLVSKLLASLETNIS